MHTQKDENNRSDIFVITHREDVDGLSSLAWLKNVFGRINYKLLGYYDMMEGFLELSNSDTLVEKNIIITDLNCDSRFQKDLKYSAIIENMSKISKKIYWIDHHTGTLDSINFLESFGVAVYHASGVCSTKLISGIFGGSFKDDLLSDIAQVHDYPENRLLNRVVPERIQKLISLYNKKGDYDSLDYLATLLSERPDVFMQRDLPIKFEKDLAEFERRFEIAEYNLFASLEYINVGEYCFVISSADVILPQKETMHSLLNEHSTADGAIILFDHPQNNALFFSNPNSSFQAVEFCKNANTYCAEFENGGGRENGGGFSSINEVNQENIEFKKNNIKKGLGEFIRQIKASKQ